MRTWNCSERRRYDFLTSDISVPSSTPRILYGLNEYISSPCIVVSFKASEISITQPTMKPMPRQPNTLDITSARLAESTRACFSLQLDTPRVQLFLCGFGSTDQKEFVIGKTKATSAAMRNQ